MHGMFSRDSQPAYRAPQGAADLFWGDVWGRFGGCLGVFWGGVWGCLGGIFVVFWEVFRGKHKGNI